MLERCASFAVSQVGDDRSQESVHGHGPGNTRAWVAGIDAARLLRTAYGSEKSKRADVDLRYGRGRAVTGIAKSSEAGLRRLESYYLRYLGRPLDPAGQSTWLPYMSGAGDFQVPGFIGGSQEYWFRAQVRFP